MRTQRAKRVFAASAAGLMMAGGVALGTAGTASASAPVQEQSHSSYCGDYYYWDDDCYDGRGGNGDHGDHDDRDWRGDHDDHDNWRGGNGGNGDHDYYDDHDDGRGGNGDHDDGRGGDGDHDRH
ncbi:hypothetical protein SUDANB15_02781 [Streptomyces sp. enrichment culture]|uniref:hypothetical protein n=1 Tax=Streptomyces sp. enrichment culture TaxID=1795815 RepID=UPI003F57839A